MEYHISSTSNQLLQSLDFTLPPAANFVQSRRTAFSYTSGASNFTYEGVRVARMVISADAWLDASTLALHFTFNNTSSDGVRPRGYASDFISRIRLFLGGLSWKM